MAISKGDGVRMEYRDAKGTLRVITGKATAVGGSTVTFKSDGGQPGFPRGKSIRVALEDVQRTSNPSPVTAQRTKGGGVKISITVPTIAAAKKIVKRLGVTRVANPGRGNSGYVVYPGGYAAQTLAAAKKKADAIARETGSAYVDRLKDEKTVYRVKA